MCKKEQLSFSELESYWQDGICEVKCDFQIEFCSFHLRFHKASNLRLLLLGGKDCQLLFGNFCFLFWVEVSKTNFENKTNSFLLEKSLSDFMKSTNALMLQNFADILQTCRIFLGTFHRHIFSHQLEISFQFMEEGELRHASFCIRSPYKTVWRTLITSYYKKLIDSLTKLLLLYQK